jgi:hypothetical protein
MAKNPKHAVAVAALVVAAVIVVYYAARTKTSTAPAPAANTARRGPADIYPNLSITPGAINPDITQENIGETICNPNWSTKSERPPTSYTNKLKREGFDEYGYTDREMKDYEEDHLISLEIGGSPTDPKNLWPEPYQASIADGGARDKDKVENYLHKQVCRGAMTLAEAQKEIVADWYEVYISKIK